MNTTKIKGDMNYLVFEKNLFNSLIVNGLKKVYINTKDYSIFHIGKDDYLSHIDWSVFLDNKVAKQNFLEKPLTILYSFCPYEICGLYTSVAFFDKKEIPIYISSPKGNEKTDIISFSDYAPDQIIKPLKSNLHSLSNSQKVHICDEWKDIIEKQSNLRIWREGNIINVDDDYFDNDIRELLQKTKGHTKESIISSVQIMLRHKYHIGLNSKFLEWRLAYILKNLNQSL